MSAVDASESSISKAAFDAIATAPVIESTQPAKGGTIRPPPPSPNVDQRGWIGDTNECDRNMVPKLVRPATTSAPEESSTKAGPPESPNAIDVSIRLPSDVP